MLTTLAAYSSWQSAPLLPLSDRGAQTDLIQITNIDGLGPVKADVNTSPYGSVDGESYIGSHTPKRNIVLDVALNPDWNEWSVEALRRLLYSYFMPGQGVHLVFHSDDLPTVWIDGRTESNEPNIFDKDGNIQISIICPDPYFTAVDPVVLQGNVGSGYRTIRYNGSIDTGVVVKVTQIVAPDAGYVSIQAGNPVASSFQAYAPVTAAKYYLMSSLDNRKFAQNVTLNTGVSTNLLSKVNEGSTWPTLVPGDNVFSVISDTAANKQQWELTYYERFGGL